jgi:hypothetical protein
LSGPPELNGAFEEVRANLGENVIFDCTAKRDNGPFVTLWLRDDKELESGPEFTVDNERLLLSHLKLNMSGKYTCEVSNLVGYSKKTFNLLVQKRPIFTDQSGVSPTIIVNKSMILDCSVEGIPLPTVTWRKVGIFMPIFDCF